MKNLRRNFERFCLKHRNKGIPNLMLYIALGSGLVHLLGRFGNSLELYYLLCFDKAAILQGQVWRLFTYVFTYTPGSNPFLVLIGLYFFYHLSRSVENTMGTFRFNLFYFTGVILMDVFAMIFCPTEDVIISGFLLPADLVSLSVYNSMAYYLHLSMVLTFCITCPDAQFLVFFIIPVKAWFLSLVYLVLTAISIYELSWLFPHNLFPLAALANFLLFAGKDVVNLLPPALRYGFQHRRKTDRPKKTGTIPFAPKSTVSSDKGAYNHKCTVCGRTDVSDPELEFRYCSRCNGYHCYCSDHINNHTHIQ